MTMEQIEEMRGLEYHEIAYRVISKFVQTSDIPEKNLRDILKRSFSTFRHKDV